MLAAGRIWPSVSRQLDNFLRPQGAFPPGFYSLRGGWADRPAPEAPLIKGMPTAPSAFLGIAERVWATALCPDPQKKRPCATVSRSVGRGTNTAAFC